MEVHSHSCTLLHKEFQHLVKVCILHSYLNWHMQLQSYAPTSVEKSHIICYNFRNYFINPPFHSRVLMVELSFPG